MILIEDGIVAKKPRKREKILKDLEENGVEIVRGYSLINIRNYPGKSLFCFLPGVHIKDNPFYIKLMDNIIRHNLHNYWITNVIGYFTSIFLRSGHPIWYKR